MFCNRGWYISSAESFNLDGVGQNAQLMSENVTSSFTQMGESTGKTLSGMKKTVVSIDLLGN